MHPWRKETLNLQVGDTIIWQDEAIKMEGQPADVAPGMKGKVLSLHDGFHLDVVQGDLASDNHFLSNCTLSGNSSSASTLIFFSQFL